MHCPQRRRTCRRPACSSSRSGRSSPACRRCIRSRYTLSSCHGRSRCARSRCCDRRRYSRCAFLLSARARMKDTRCKCRRVFVDRRASDRAEAILQLRRHPTQRLLRSTFSRVPIACLCSANYADGGRMLTDVLHFLPCTKQPLSTSCCVCSTSVSSDILSRVSLQVTGATPARPPGANVTVKELLDWLMPRLPENMKEQMSHAQVGCLWQTELMLAHNLKQLSARSSCSPPLSCI